MGYSPWQQWWKQPNLSIKIVKKNIYKMQKYKKRDYIPCIMSALFLLPPLGVSDAGVDNPAADPRRGVGRRRAEGEAQRGPLRVQEEARARPGEEQVMEQGERENIE